MPLPVWIGLGVLVLAFLGGAVFVVLRGLEAYKTLRSSGGKIETAMNDLLERVARMEERTSALEASTPRVERSLERLRSSMEVLQIELQVIQEARAPIARLRGLTVRR
jgi:exonuclease VII small subunit